ncbi:MAG: nitrile hydratase accessory protein, partial [Candidatus Binatia bacterium]|nr:nitrile hydratase accessory protein [Candidatus Binatia bacterium]
ERMSEEELAALVTRDAMIGVARVAHEKKETVTLPHRHVADMEGATALPRQSGELVFQDPWEGEAFALAVALCEQGLYRWDEFRERLIVELAAAERPEIPEEQRPSYYECWLAAFESLVVQKNILTKKRIETRATWLARSASGFASRSFLHLRWSPPEEDE